MAQQYNFKARIYNYNNYYNRHFKKHNYLDGYGDPLYTWNMVSFNPNDGINTELICNSFQGANTNYVIITAISNNNEIIHSRWFVLESTFENITQYRLKLRRDVLADYLNSDMVVYAERGYVPNTNNLIFNSEGNSYNQIKKKESILKDETASPWLVGYLASNVFEQGNIKIDLASTADINYDYSYTTVENMLQANKFTSLSSTNTVYLDPSIEFMSFYSTRSTVIKTLWQLKYQFMYTDISTTDNTFPYPPLNITGANESKALIYFNENLMNQETKKDLEDRIIYDNPQEMLTTKEFVDLFSRENKIARVGTASTGYSYYKLIISAQSETTKNITKTVGAVKTYLDNKIQPMITDEIATGSVPDEYNIRYSTSPYLVYWQQLTTLGTTITLSQDAPAVDKSPYYCFAIPYNSIAIKLNGLMTNTNAALSRQLARKIAIQLSSFCYDVQLLPYFPLQSYIDGTATVDITQMSNKQYAILKDSQLDSLRSVLFWISEPNFSFTIEDSILYNSQEPKVQNETQFCRLNSPNYSASFDFSVAKNKGVSYWNVDCSYKPYQPYIHVAPDWKGLYGSNFNDARGLICTGDFSIDLMTDKWQEYQIQNKNYNEIFNRQIQTLDLQQSIQRKQEKWAVAAGALQGLTSGMAAGAQTSNPYLMAAGAIGGGSLSALGGLADIKYNEQLREDTRSAQFDMFNYQLGNIKALPNTLTKVSTYNINNKIYPFYEIYEATEEEINSLKNQLLYRGYNLNIIDKLNKFTTLGTYFKGKLIKINENNMPAGDSHLFEAINEELTLGIYWVIIPLSGGIIS